VRLLRGSATAAERGIKVWRSRKGKGCDVLEGIREESVGGHRVRLSRHQGRRLAVANRTRGVHVTLLKDHLPRDYFLRRRERMGTALVSATVFRREIKLLRIAGLRGMVALMRVALHVL
jgi:hypothetical protein